MAERYTATFISVLFLFFTSTLASLNTFRGYIEYGLDSPTICDPLRTTVVNDLKNRRDSAIIVKPSHVFDSWIVKYNKHCKFKIETADGDGLFAVIQRMSLRRNGDECLDYIKFTTSETGSKAEKFCGKVDMLELVRSEYESSEEFVQGKYEQFNKKGKIETEIVISREPLRPGEELDLEIVYTPYRKCEKADTASGLFWPLPDYKNICIYNKFVCDAHLNCASYACKDETNCTIVVNRIVSDGTGTKVTVSAVTTIFLCFIIFGLCLWICRKHKKLCWSPDCAGPSNTISGSVSGLPMERGEQNTPNTHNVPTAPMLEVAVSTQLHDKDLPPSYDSLFPSQANANNT